MKSSSESGRQPPALWVALGVATVVLGVFWPALGVGFIELDDADYVLSNPFVQRGLTPETARWIFQVHYHGPWHPLTWLSHILDVALFGLMPFGHHLTSLLLHAGAAGLFGAFLAETTGAPLRSAAAALLFSLHPFRVESVAWIAERKDVLAGFFLSLTLLSYAAYARRPDGKRYSLFLLVFLLGLAAKPTMAVVPLLLLLVDTWPLKRWWGKAERRRLLLEKVPPLAAAAACVLCVACSHGEAPEAAVPWFARLAGAPFLIMRYLVLSAWPAELSLYPAASPASATVSAAAAGAVAVVTAAAAARRLERPAFFTGWLWFVGALLPLAGLMPQATQVFAQRYTYIPHLGLACLVIWGLVPNVPRMRASRSAWAAGGAVVAILLAFATRRELDVWRDHRALFEQALRTSPGNFRLHNALAVILAESGDDTSARAEFEEAARLRPGEPQAMANLARLMARRGRWPEAIGFYRMAAARGGGSDVWDRLGVLLTLSGRAVEAEAVYREALARWPEDVDGHNDFGTLLAREGRFAESREQFADALRLRPDHPRARENLRLAEERLQAER